MTKKIRIAGTPASFFISTIMNNKKIIISTLLFAVGLIATITTKHTVISLIGIAVAVVGLWMLRKAIVERRKAKTSQNYQRLDTENAETDNATANPTNDSTKEKEEKRVNSIEPANEEPKNEPVDPEMETIHKNAMLTLIKYVMEVDSMVRMGISQEPQKVTVDQEYLIFVRKAKDKATMDTIKMMPEMMANLAMMQMMRHENIHDVVDAAYFTGKSIKTIWVDDNDEKTEMVFPHVSFERVFEETNHTPDKTRFLTPPKNIFG